MKLFRGIAVPKHQLESVIENIRLNGIINQSKTSWQMKQWRLNDLNTLHLKPDLSREDTLPKTGSIEAVCACGDKDGALYYATKHNFSKTNNAPVVIEIDDKKTSLVIDGRDFLYTSFQYSHPAKARPILEKCFGSAILKYANKAWSSQDQNFKVAQCDLAIQDPAVIEAHHANDIVIAGRWKTVFRSAFTIKLPILPESIVSIYSPSKFSIIPQPNIKFDDIMDRKNTKRAT